MIKVMLLSGTELQRGGEELFREWQKTRTGFMWMDLELGDEDSDKAILEQVGCHELAILDALRDRHPPKTERFADQFFILFRGISNSEPGLLIETLQLSFFVGENYLVTRHAKPSLTINEWWPRENIATLVSQPAVLAVKLMHFSAGLYLQRILEFEVELSEIEDDMDHADDETLRRLMLFKTELRRIRRTFEYHERIVRSLMNKDSGWYEKNQKNLIHSTQDLYDRCERLHTLSGMYYEICGDLIYGYLSIASHMLNKTMRVLTVITAIFIPLGFMAGLYGMNFENMPELRLEYGYFYLLSCMGLLATALLIVFKKKHWL